MLANELKNIRPSFKKCAILRDSWYVSLGSKKLGSVILRGGKWFYEKSGSIGPSKGLLSRDAAVDELLRLDDKVH